MRFLPVVYGLFFFVGPAYAATKVRPPVWSDFPMVVPAVEKDGHAWKIEVDNYRKNERAFVGIAVVVHNNEILFGEYVEGKPGQKGKASFYSPRGGRSYTNDQFFLLQADFMAYERVPFTELDQYLDRSKNQPNKRKGCTPVVFVVDNLAYMPVLDKPGNRGNAKNFKKIGTYFVQSDTMSYPSPSQNFVQDHMTDFVKGPNRGDRVEFLCRKNHTYS